MTLDSFMAGKNAQVLEHGFSPAQHLLGRQVRIPAELLDEQFTSSMAVAVKLLLLLADVSRRRGGGPRLQSTCSRRRRRYKPRDGTR